MSKSLMSFSQIKQDLGHLGDDIARQYALQAEYDLNSVHKQIIDKFYEGHKPSMYHRKNGLYDSLLPQGLKRIGNKSWSSSIIVSSFDMEDHYGKGATPDMVLDLMWDNGIRGLPHYGKEPLDHDFTFYHPSVIHSGEMDHVLNSGTAGQIWVNRYWSGEDDPYHNIFKTKIKFGKHTTKVGTPDEIMTDFTNNWANSLERTTVNKIDKIIKSKYN